MSRFRKYGYCYLIVGITAVVLKLFYSRAGSDELLWMLAPVAWWVRILSGISFEYLPDIGYVNHTIQFVIASSCSGVQFLIIAMLMSVCSFAHRMGTVKKGMLWTFGSVAGAYLYTIFVNGIRIVLSICLPRIMQQVGAGTGWLMQKRLHTIIGTAVYFISLLILYQVTERISWKLVGDSLHGKGTASDKTEGRQHSGWKTEFCLPPVAWYYFIVLGIPFLNRAWGSNRKGFVEYACVVTCVCLPLLLLRWTMKKTAERFRR